MSSVTQTVRAPATGLSERTSLTAIGNRMNSTSHVPITESPDVVELLDKVDITPIEQDTDKIVCCVTGATSMVGSHLVRRLLRVGHTVHAPVRSLDEAKIGFLKAMPGATERLKLFKVTICTSSKFSL